jgi:hypothetical protein
MDPATQQVAERFVAADIKARGRRQRAAAADVADVLAEADAPKDRVRAAGPVACDIRLAEVENLVDDAARCEGLRHRDVAR